MRLRRQFRSDCRGGVVLDLVLALGLLLLAAFALHEVGVSFRMILHGAERFFGV